MLDALTVPDKHRGISAALQGANDEAVALEKRRCFVAAEVVVRRALAEAPKSVPLLTNLGCVLLSQRRLDDAKVAFREALDIDPNYAVAWSNLGLAYEGLKEFVEAQNVYDRALSINHSYLNARWDLSLLDLGLGNYKKGFMNYDARLSRKPDDYPRQPCPLWEGEDLHGKTIFVSDEQGIGDTILFSRFLPDLATRAKKVFLYLPPPRMALLWEYRNIVEMIPGGVPAPKTDYQTFLGSLPRFYSRLSQSQIPPPDPMRFIAERVKIEDERANQIVLPSPPTFWDNELRVGIRWSGNPNQEVNGERSIPVDQLVRAVGCDPRVWLYSLQEGHGAGDLATHGMDGNIVYDLSSRLTAKGLAGLGSVMKQLDLVITCCTSVAHLAGALGVPCWVLLHRIPYWVWGFDDSTTSPWYPSVRLFRQTVPGDWSSVLSQVSNSLREI